VAVGSSRKLRSAVQRVCSRAGVTVEGFKSGSDNGVFHDHGVPDVYFGDRYENGHIPLHSTEDSLEVIDWRRLTATCRLIAETFAMLMQRKT
jgi:hypothetical protein